MYCTSEEKLIQRTCVLELENFVEIIHFLKVETSRIFHVSVFFACKMKKLMDGKLAPLKRRGRSAKLTGAHVKWAHGMPY